MYRKILNKKTNKHRSAPKSNISSYIIFAGAKYPRYLECHKVSNPNKPLLIKKKSNMKNLLPIIAFVFIIVSSFAQPSAYQKVMGKALISLGAAESSEDLQKVGNQFQRIANQMPNEWLPLYYQSLALCRQSYEETKKGDELADEAQRVLDLATPLAKEPTDKSELKTLQGMIYIAKLIVDPMSRGQLYSAMSGEAYQEALQLNPTNPRARLMSIRSKMGAAQFFKQDLTPFVKAAQLLVDEWDNFKPVSRLHPNWGREMAKSMAKQDIKSEKTDVNEAKPATPDTKPVSKAKPVRIIENTPSPGIEPMTQEGFTISFTIIGLHSNKGRILVELLDANKNSVENKTVIVQNKQAKVQFVGLKAGIYAMKFFHDENEDGKMNFGFMHIPKEGYGYANDARGKMGPPDFKETTFEVDADVNMTVTTKYH